MGRFGRIPSAEAARRASREPLREAPTHVDIDRQLCDAGWVVRDEREMSEIDGRAAVVLPRSRRC